MWRLRRRKSSLEKSFETEVLSRLAVIESKLDGYKDIKKVAYEADNLSKENYEDIKELQDKIKWLSRTTVSAIIAGVVGIVFLLIQTGMGVN